MAIGQHGGKQRARRKGKIDRVSKTGAVVFLHIIRAGHIAQPVAQGAALPFYLLTELFVFAAIGDIKIGAKQTAKNGLIGIAQKIDSEILIDLVVTRNKIQRAGAKIHLQV